MITNGDFSKVIAAIKSEREYQDSKRPEKYNDNVKDTDKSIADFVLYIDYILEDAMDAVYHLDKEEQLSAMRKIAALAIACMESHGIVER